MKIKYFSLYTLCHFFLLPISILLIQILVEYGSITLIVGILAISVTNSQEGDDTPVPVDFNQVVVPPTPPTSDRSVPVDEVIHSLPHKTPTIKNETQIFIVALCTCS